MLIHFVQLMLQFRSLRLSLATSFAGCRFSLGDIDWSTASVEEMSGMRMLFPKTLDRLHQPILCPHRHLRDAESGFDLCIADDIVFSELLHTERIERKVKPASDFGDAIHQSFWQAPDVRLLSHRSADDCNQFIGGKGFVIAHMINSGWNRLCQQSVNHIAEIPHRGK